MRLIAAVVAALSLTFSSPAQAQSWVSYVSMEDHFAHWFPHEPTVEPFEWTDEADMAVPGRKYTAERNGSTYTLYAMDYSNSAFSAMRGSVAHWATHYRQMGEVTYDAYAQIDRIEGHQLQITLEGGRKIYFAAFIEGPRLYVLDANIAPRAAPPIQFQQSLQLLDESGLRIRYGNDGERILRTDDLAEGLGGPVEGGCILEGTSDQYICPEGVEPPAR
jgi:hypothetical protein